jgi:hypothetical protein
MWKYRDEEELKKIRQRKKNAYKEIWRPCILAIFLFFIWVIRIKIGFKNFRVPHIDPITWRDFLENELLKAILIGLITFIVIYAGQIISKRRIFSGPEAMICLKCKKLKNDDKNYKCDCGGEFIPLDELEWVDEEKNGIKNVED